VPKGGIVARVDSNLAGMQLASDKASAARLDAQLRFDRNQAQRLNSLLAQNAIAKSTRDQAESTRDMDAAALAQAQAAVHKSQYQFDHSDIRAPFPAASLRADQSWRIRDGRQADRPPCRHRLDRSERPDTDRNGRHLREECP